MKNEIVTTCLCGKCKETEVIIAENLHDYTEWLVKNGFKYIKGDQQKAVDEYLKSK